MKKLVLGLVMASMLSGCVHTEPNQTIQEYKPGDESASCLMLKGALANAQKQKAQAHQDHTDQIVSNVVYGITGAIILVPWFFIDTGTGHSTDERNADARIEQLNIMLAEKHCNAPTLAAN